jgi:hypothetical protein
MFRTLGFNDLAQCAFPWEERAVEAWRWRFHREYERCLCWECEMLLYEIGRVAENARARRGGGPRIIEKKGKLRLRL